MNITLIAELITAFGVLAGAFVTVFTWFRRITVGQKCFFRSEMLRIYYKNRENRTIHQYEAENFTLLYNAYKSLKGNSFIDLIRNEVVEWEIIP